MTLGRDDIPAECRIADIWNCEVITIGSIEVAIHTATAGIKTLAEAGYSIDPETGIQQLLTIDDRVRPDPAYLRAYRGEYGYLRKLISVFENRTGVE